MTVVIHTDKPPKVGDAISFSAADILHNWTVRLYNPSGELLAEREFYELTEKELNAECDRCFADLRYEVTNNGKAK